MIEIKFIKKIPASVHGVGGPYQPGKVYSLPDDVAKGFIATKDPDWEEIPAKANRSNENQSQSAAGSSNKRR